ATVAFARERGLSVHPRGAGSGLCGGALGGGIVVDFTRYMNRLIRIDLDAGTVECEPGYRLGELEAALAGTGLFFPPDPSSGEYATLGGMVATNASGAHSVKYGNVADYLLDAAVVTGDGRTIILSDIEGRDVGALPPHLQALHRLYTENTAAIEGSYPSVRCNVAGYNLRGLVSAGRLRLAGLFAGAEGTLGIAVRLTFRLREKPAHDSLVVAFFDDIVNAATAVQHILPMGPSGIEGMDKSLLDLARESDPRLRDRIPAGVDNVLLIEFDGDAAACARSAEAAKSLIESAGLARDAHLAVSTGEKARFWAVRKAAVPILYRLKGEKKILALIEDAAVPTDRLVDYFAGIYEILNRHGVRFVTYGHIAKGLLHTRPLLDLRDAGDVALLKPLADDVFALVHTLGGSVSGEHGDGRLRSAYIRQCYPEIWGLFTEVKRLLDPAGIFNPEIKTHHDPEQMTQLLRYGASYTASDVRRKALLWPEGFVREAEKCHGCAKCTTTTTAARMCPVYKFTRDEEASPRAKANLLRGLISGALPDRALYERAFQRVMERCVHCGSCAHECPSGVNIPKLAVEARAQYVERFGATLENRILTAVEFAGRAAQHLPRALKDLAKTGVARKAAERFAGISARRAVPDFPARSLYDRVPGESGGGPIRVLYFAGCYASYIRPEIGEAAVRVLTAMGMRVQVPRQHCCGLPMLAKGMTAAASKKIRDNLGRWGRLAASADYVGVTCSSCGLSLMREWVDLIDTPDIRAIREKTIHISRLINRCGGRLRLSPLPGRAAYHAPCHLKVQPSPESSLTLLSRVPGLDTLDLDSHCCGMAGTWGMCAANDGLSRRIGAGMIARLDRSGAAFGVTDCPTCRMQMEEMSETPIRHPVEIVSAALSV
ncbi:anaerobic glycerol-3-phosphate dehydrogenase subunit C, partial [Desulfococcus sp.]|uniref:anaerobic glycerol-3-phosphate dehydrogenase subunit C n=1 Tax=Desulfococcus sp. TaxID=2025834 RepID=UPI0035936ECE